MAGADPIDRFLAMLAAERGGAANTLAAYRRDLVGAAEALGRSGERLAGGFGGAGRGLGRFGAGECGAQIFGFATVLRVLCR